MNKKIVTLYHDIEQNIDVQADPGLCEKVVREMLALERKFGVRCTYNVVGVVMEQQPELIRKIVADGHELAFHSYQHQSDWNATQYWENVSHCRRINPETKGYRSPRSQWDEQTMKALWRNNFYWSAEADDAVQPYFINKGLVRLPIAGDDWPLFTGTLTADGWLQRFERFCNERQYFGYGSHDFVFASDPENYLTMYKRLLEHIREMDIFTATFGEVADLFRRSAISDFYNKTASTWNQATTELYRTGRYREIVTEEANAIRAPVIADLGSAGGALSKHLANAQKIYCVDMAGGMLQSISADNVQTVIGDVTDSKLEDHCADLVIVARVIEYLFEPILLLNEIKRIAKQGARVVFTFPALADQLPSNEGDPPSRVRKHYTREEVELLGQSLGEGRVIGIHYLGGKEPTSDEEKKNLIDMEYRQPEGQQPLDWVFTGNVNNLIPILCHHHTISLKDHAFNTKDMQTGLLLRIVNKVRRLKQK